MTVFHGSTAIIKTPDVFHSFRPLDFGKGFYVTTNKVQASIWAKRKSVIECEENAFITQKAIDKILKFVSFEEV